MPLKRLHILLAEDDLVDAELFDRALRPLCRDCRVTHLQHGGRVLEYLQGTGPFADRTLYPFPTMLVLDMKLPGVDGTELIEALRHRADLPPLFLVKLTGGFTGQAPVSAMETFGRTTVCHASFLKPVTHDVLRALLSLFEAWALRWLSVPSPAPALLPC